MIPLLTATAILLLLCSSSPPAAEASPASPSSSSYVLGATGQSCSDACLERSLNCNPRIVTSNSAKVFALANATCAGEDPAPWKRTDQPSVDARGVCGGYVDAPGAVICGGRNATTRRVCRCDAPRVAATATFGTSLSSGTVEEEETTVFAHVLAAGQAHAAMTHFWTTYPSKDDPGVLVCYYVDGEAEASVQFRPSLAAGAGFYAADAPWGTARFGKGAKDGAWFFNLPVPFQRSVRVTVRRTTGAGDPGSFYMIVRGSAGVAPVVSGAPLPAAARLVQTRVMNRTLAPLEFVELAAVPEGHAGLHFMTALQAHSANPNFLEGCFHAYQYVGEEWPGTVLSSGTEDYVNSAWYFDAGGFHLPLSGLTSLSYQPGGANVSLSFYVAHETAPMPFSDGFTLQWRNGDTRDASGHKCFSVNGTAVGSPMPTVVTSYAWSYAWPAK